RTSRCWRRGSIPASSAAAPSRPATSAPRLQRQPPLSKRTATNWPSATTDLTRSPGSPSFRTAGSARPALSSGSACGWRRAEPLAAEGRDPGLGPTEDQRMDVVRALVSIDRLQVHHVANHVVLVVDAVAAMHVAGEAGDIEGLAAIVALQQRDRLGRAAVLVFQPAEPQARH